MKEPTDRWVAVVLVGLVAACAPPVRAATHTVTPCTEAQLRSVIDGAAAGDLVVLPAGCTVVLTGNPGEDANVGGDLDLTQDLTIAGAGPGSSVLDGGAVDRVLDVQPGVSVTLVGLAVRNGNLQLIGQSGGGIRNQGVLALHRVEIRDNQAFSSGGIANLDGGRLTVVDSRIVDNAATIGAGVGTVSSGGATTTRIDRSTISGNVAENTVGGLANKGAVAVTVLRAVRVEDNQAPSIGGIGNSEGTVLAEETLVAGNTATTGSFGGIANVDGVLTISRSTVSGNRAAGNFGRVASTRTAVAPRLLIENSTVSGNVAAGLDGGVSSNAGSVEIVHSTITGNIAQGGGAGGLRVVLGIATLRGTILAGNSAPNCAVAGGGAAIASAGSNLDDGATCGLGAPGDVSGADPLLGSLADHGGPTPTHDLRPGSPALDTANPAGCPAIDQRGVTRPQDPGCDMGAFEARVLPSRGTSGTFGGRARE